MAVVMNNTSLTPTKLDPNAPFTPSNYPDGRSVVGAFRRAVQMALEEQEERDALFAALRKFDTTRVVEDLMDDLKIILDHPEKRILYKFISPLIPQRLRGEYKGLVPHIPNFERKIVRLKVQGSSHSFGFTVQGGKEYGCGIFVTNVLKSSRAEQAGLMPGDQIVRLNGLILTECLHEEFVNLVKNKKSLILTVKVVGLIPEKLPGSKVVTWKSVGERRSWRPTTRIGVHGPIQSTRKIHVRLESHETLGATVKASSAVDGGVLILDVLPNSPADNAGLRRGDEIICVNDTSLIGMTLDEATGVLRSSNTLMLTIKVDEPSTSTKRHSQESVPISDFVTGGGAHDFDSDFLGGGAARSWWGTDNDSGFVLRPRATPPQTKKTAPLKKNTSRISVTNEDVEQSRLPPPIASPAVFGHGPAVSMPTIMGLATQDMPEYSLHDSHDFDSTLMSFGGGGDLSFSPQVFSIGRATVEGQGSPSPRDDDDNVFQFSSSNAEGDRQMGRQNSALKKRGSGPKHSPKKHPSFDENVQIIPQPTMIPTSPSKDTLNSIKGAIHPSNLTFSEEILQGRKVVFHTIPKNGPLKLAIRGGRDTPLGPKIIVSRIIEGGAAHRYGKLNVGDQVLVCDGVSLLDVTHDEAGEAFKKAMDVHTQSIDLVVAVNPETN